MANTNADIIRREFASDAAAVSGLIAGQLGMVTVTPFKIHHKTIGGVFHTWTSDSGDKTQAGKVTIVKTTDQLELQYDGSNTLILSVGSSGNTTITPSGTKVIIPDNKYLEFGTSGVVGTLRFQTAENRLAIESSLGVYIKAGSGVLKLESTAVSGQGITLVGGDYAGTAYNHAGGTARYLTIDGSGRVLVGGVVS